MVSQGPCVSIYMPTQRVEAELAQNPIRLKNLAREAREQLRERSTRAADIDAIMRPVDALLDRDDTLWYAAGDGLALFLTPEQSFVYRLPLRFEELAFVNQRFHLKPLFPLIASNNRFYLLALSQQRVRLYQGTHYRLSEVESTAIPPDIWEAVLKYEEEEQSVQFHTGVKMNAPGGRKDQIVHGQGRQDGDVLSPHSKLRRFFQKVNEGVMETLRDERAPLLLAGVEYYLPIYREANSYQHLIADQIVAGNPDALSSKELHAKAWQIMEPFFQLSQEESIAQFKEHIGRGDLASTDLREIVPAAFFSRVDTLFVPIGHHVWGHYDPDANRVAIADEKAQGVDDLLDLAAVQTYLKGGTVHALREENMPTDSEPLAALFRFPANVMASQA